MNLRTGLRSALAATMLASVPWLAVAQTAPAPANTPTTGATAGTPAQSVARTREDVSREVREAMRAGSWRCLTNSRGWCRAPVATASKDGAK